MGESGLRVSLGLVGHWSAYGSTAARILGATLLTIVAPFGAMLIAFVTFGLERSLDVVDFFPFPFPALLLVVPAPPSAL